MKDLQIEENSYIAKRFNACLRQYFGQSEKVIFHKTAVVLLFHIDTLHDIHKGPLDMARYVWTEEEN